MRPIAPAGGFAQQRLSPLGGHFRNYDHALLLDLLWHHVTNMQIASR
jgi:hypothetical protein